MIPDLSPIFAQYERLRDLVDAAFERVRTSCGDRVACRPGCSSCCHALFDLSLVEAMYLNRAFSAKFGFGPERSAILERAGATDRKLARVKRDLFREEKRGRGVGAILEEAAELRMPCPLLGGDDMCVLYEARPITCRAYGIPTAIGGQGHVCGTSGFDAGGQYPTLRLDSVQDTLASMSLAVERALGSRFDSLHEVYMPVSMALITRFDEQFLGIGQPRRED